MKRSNNTDIESQLKAYYQDIHLDEKKMDELLSMSANHTPTTRNERGSRRHFLIAASVAGTAVALGSSYGLIGWHQQRRRSQLSDNVQLIAELVVNHQNRPELDIQSNSVQKIAQRLSDVSFDLELPERLLAHADLIGGRYCSLLGERAIQIRLMRKDSPKEVTAFVTAATTSLTDLDGITSTTEGLTISTNRYRNLFVAEVREL